MLIAIHIAQKESFTNLALHVFTRITRKDYIQKFLKKVWNFPLF